VAQDEVLQVLISSSSCKDHLLSPIKKKKKTAFFIFFAGLELYLQCSVNWGQSPWVQNLPYNLQRQHRVLTLSSPKGYLILCIYRGIYVR